MKNRLRIYIDMDGTICDYITPYKMNLKNNPNQTFPQSQYGFFIKLQPIDNAIHAINVLKKYHDVWILTRPSTKNLNSYSEKAYWVLENLGQDMLDKTIFSCDKSLLIGDILIDDENNANQDKFNGRWIQYGTDKYKNWVDIMNELII